MIKQIIVRGYRLFKDIDLRPRMGTNILVGDNDSGKSTLLEAISLALTGRVNGRWAQDELNPYWFNSETVAEYFEKVATDRKTAPPEILVELYFEDLAGTLQRMRGVHNSRREDCPGIKLRVFLAAEYQEEFYNYLDANGRSQILPTEWFDAEWSDFSDERLTRRPQGLGVSVIDSRTIRSSTGVDHHTREMIGEFIAPKERAAIAVAHRSARHDISAETLSIVNQRIAEQGNALHDNTIELDMDQSSNSSWESTIVPHIDEIPFALIGQGQQAAVKISLAMNRAADTTSYTLIEEPENHLSHTSLTRLVARLEGLAGERQLFLTTHSSYVLNRLGLDALTLLYRGRCASFSQLPQDTIDYFKRLSGYDTLRLVLADKVVLVEGPADEMVVGRAFRERQGAEPMALGVDIVSMRGVAFRRGLQLCAALGRRAAAVRDNDGQAPEHWRKPLAPWLEDGNREMFIGDPSEGKTLEPQFVNSCGNEAMLREALGVPEGKSTAGWMEDHKTEWALKLVESDAVLSYPAYINQAVEFVS